MGEHTMDVCERIIGLTMDEIADLLAEGVLVRRLRMAPQDAPSDHSGACPSLC
ncbi:hypothetical protein [Candidatus Amarobacter glycogenicus]|uniref:hypothetical protein n=1 Tax=Candidatus Amarobacter glycogenicus TaxID=3140699 RepID=UPI002A14B0DE|nr:hypothetical protein [Dehalococcoidia bacterium]